MIAIQLTRGLIDPPEVSVASSLSIQPKGDQAWHAAESAIMCFEQTKKQSLT